MDILDIAIAKKAALGVADTTLARANEALTTANQASEVATTASQRASAAADTYDNLLAVTDESMLADFTDEIESLSVSNVQVIDENDNNSKSKKIVVTKEKTSTNYVVNKNYTSTGENEDGSMTQKAITEAIQQLEQELTALKILLGVE